MTILQLKLNTKEKDIMTRSEMIKYFNRLAFEFDTIFARTGDLEAKGKSEAYELAAFNIERNLKNICQ